MRQSKQRKQARNRFKPVHLTQAEKLHRRRVKRKQGPAALKRKAAREKLQRKTAVVEPTE